MKVIFMGTPHFAVPALEKILASHHELCCVVCQPDRVGNRNKIIACEVKQWAVANNVELFQFEKASTDENIATLAKFSPDIIVTAAYGQLLSQQLIDLPKYGIINIHGSLLPKLRGASPIQSSLINGDSTTGITILNTVKRMDAGAIISQESLEINESENFGELYNRMAVLGSEMIVSTLDSIADGSAVYREQDETQVTFCRKILAEHEKINWNKTNSEVVNLIRGLNPAPKANTILGGKGVKILSATINEMCGERAGEVISVTKKSLAVSCGSGSVDIKQLQPVGGKIMDITSFLCGNKLVVGDKVGDNE